MLESQAQHIEALQRCDDVSPPYSLVADAQLMHCVELGWAASSGFAQRRTLLFFYLFSCSRTLTSRLKLFRAVSQLRAENARLLEQLRRLQAALRRDATLPTDGDTKVKTACTHTPA